MNPQDFTYVLLVAIAVWLAFSSDSDIGGGKRQRVPAAS